MTKVTCAISGIQFSCEHFQNPPLAIAHSLGYFHPIFAASYGDLYRLYSHHSKGRLTSTDSYLLFLAFLHSSDQIEWEHPVTLSPTARSTIQLVENNLGQLIAILEKTALIQSSSFEQPRFIVSYDNSQLRQISNWITAWEENLANYRVYRSDMLLSEKLTAVSNKLSKLVRSPEKPLEEYADVVAEWADRAAGFPPSSAVLWRKTIESCFKPTAMFNTPLPLLKEIKDYVECNIDVGSIHFHTLLEVLVGGIARHVDYLGGGILARGYELLPKDPFRDQIYARSDDQLLEIIANAPVDEPEKGDYDSPLAHLKAKLAYSAANRLSTRISTNIVDAASTTTTKNTDPDIGEL